MSNCVLFGVAGNPPNFWSSKFHRDRTNAPEWLHSIGLDALEIQCGYGVRMSDAAAKEFRDNSQTFGITLSLHAPYYISLGNSDPKKTDNSLNELGKSVELARKIGCNKVIFHLGSIHGDRAKARRRTIEALSHFENTINLARVRLYPEIGGKENQLGSLEDIITICESVHSASPCLDLAHLHARTHGSLVTKENFVKVIDKIEQRLGKQALEQLHIHLYPVEWGVKGEVRHKAFFDKVLPESQISFLQSNTSDPSVYLPRYEPFLDLIVEKQLFPTIICEAKDSQDLGALEMKNYYEMIKWGTVLVHKPK